MTLIVAKMRKKRKIRIRKDCIREIISIDSRSHCFGLVRNDSEIDKGDYWEYEPLTYKRGFNIKTIYKYLDLEAFIKTLTTGFLFKEPSLWPDPYENMFYSASYKNIDKQFIPKPLYACCYTTGDETDASWKQYANNKGLGSKCVRIKLDFKKLLEFLDTYAEKNQCKVYIGAVSYKYDEQEIDLFSVKGTKWNSFWFTKFTLNNYLSLMLIKRQAYYTEKEVRIIIVPDSFKKLGKKGQLFVDKNLNWDEVIKEVILCPDSTNEELDFVKHICEQNGILCKVTKSTLEEKKTKNEIFQVEKNISFIADIYDEI